MNLVSVIARVQEAAEAPGLISHSKDKGFGDPLADIFTTQYNDRCRQKRQQHRE